MATKQCAKCGQEFGCANPTPGCWCEELTVAPKQLQHLRETYNDCLCPTCLEEYANND